ncbi:DUF1854 domain-containing protein [uncultured Lamprocystis sp.]|jgi:hypothetical protein|uniref:cyanophycin metabolism-associated DUF1854 family protein n=1 Tax=uncultured Lamprocystis sp. TaxID=543132 RepID=UPI0025F276D0|nr:DUF1854 domain-containing protein [uncultured Lamprocystis sp.]
MTNTAQESPGFHLRIDPWGRLVYRDETGGEHADAVPVRAFPITDPDHWVILCDAQGRELRCIEDLAALPDEVRTALEDELARREFVPQIRRVIQVSSYLEPAQWEVETDRGRTSFVLKTEDDVRRLGPYSALLLDSQGIRYLVADTRNLDSYGRRAVDRYL